MGDGKTNIHSEQPSFEETLVEYLSLFEKGEKVFELSNRIIKGERLIGLEEIAEDGTESLADYISLKKPGFGVLRYTLALIGGLLINPAMWVIVFFAFKAPNNLLGNSDFILIAILAFLVISGFILLSNYFINFALLEIKRSNYLRKHPDFHRQLLNTISNKQQLHKEDVKCEKCGKSFARSTKTSETVLCKDCQEKAWRSI
ncbi:MAG: hypothetical protein AB2536_09475 [Candidatus Thiodiazotropha endolucinida]